MHLLEYLFTVVLFIATADPRLILWEDLESISGPSLSLCVTLAKCNSWVHRPFSSMKLRTLIVNYIPDCFKEGIFSKMILEGFVSLIANGNFPNVMKHQIRDFLLQRSRNAISGLWIVFDCKQGHSDHFEVLPDCFKEGISPSTPRLSPRMRIRSFGGKESPEDFIQYLSDRRKYQYLSHKPIDFLC